MMIFNTSTSYFHPKKLFKIFSKSKTQRFFDSENVKDPEPKVITNVGWVSIKNWSECHMDIIGGGGGGVVGGGGGGFCL